jgi:hypothetical protein
VSLFYGEILLKLLLRFLVQSIYGKIVKYGIIYIEYFTVVKRCEAWICKVKEEI